MNDFARARKLQRRKDREARAAAWADKVSFDIRLTWPRDTLGRVLGLTMLLAPTGLLVLGAYLARWRPQRRSGVVAAIRTLAATLVVCVVALALQTVGIALGLGTATSALLFWLPVIALVVTTFMITTRRAQESDDGDDDAARPREESSMGDEKTNDTLRLTIDLARDPEHPTKWGATCLELGAKSTMLSAHGPHGALEALARAVGGMVRGIAEARGTPDAGLEVLREIAAGYAAQQGKVQR